MKQVVVLGGSNTDITTTPLVEGIVEGSSNPGRVEVSAGGVGRNVAESVARLDVPVTLLSAVEGGPMGEMLLDRTRMAGVDVSRVTRGTGDEHSLYVAYHDREGELLLGISDMSVTSLCTPAYVEEHREVISEAAYLVLDANLPFEATQRAVAIANEAEVPVLLDPVSVAKARAVAALEGELYLATPNRDEAPILMAGGVSVRHLLITKGAQGVEWVEGSGGEERSFGVMPVEDPKTNGAGDAFLAGVTAAMYHGIALGDAIGWGMAAARMTVATVETTDSRLNRKRIEEEVKRCS